MSIMQTSFLATRLEVLGPQVAKTCGDVHLAFPEGMLGSLLPCLAIGNLYSQVVFDRHFPRIRKGKPGL